MWLSCQDMSVHVVLCWQVRKDHWKGMSAAQREAIAQEQLGQVLARRAAAAQAAAEEAAAAAEQHRVHKAVMQQVKGLQRDVGDAPVLLHKLFPQYTEQGCPGQLHASCRCLHSCCMCIRKACLTLSVLAATLLATGPGRRRLQAQAGSGSSGGAAQAGGGEGGTRCADQGDLRQQGQRQLLPAVWHQPSLTAARPRYVVVLWAPLVAPSKCSGAWLCSCGVQG